MIKIIGAVLIVGAAGGFGIGKALQFYRQMNQLSQMLAAIEILKCELNYTLRPLASLCRQVAKRTDGAVRDFFECYAKNLDKELPRASAAARAMNETKRLILPNDAKMAVLELCSTIGRYDLDGENRLLQVSGHRLRAAIDRFEKEKKPIAKSYAVLGFSTGIALVILFV